jgi:hypothetical protein
LASAVEVLPSFFFFEIILWFFFSGLGYSFPTSLTASIMDWFSFVVSK